MNSKNYWPIQKFSPWYAYFLFFDVGSYLADQLFIKRKVRVWFGDEFKCKDGPYVAIFCHVKKKDVTAFLEAMEELKKSMLICGYKDYEEKVSELVARLDKEKEAVSHAECENDSHEKAEQKEPA